MHYSRKSASASLLSSYGRASTTSYREPESRRDFFRSRSSEARSHQRVTENNRNASTANRSSASAMSSATSNNERLVSILNHCFDDIEKFVMRLSHVQITRGKKRKSKKNSSGPPIPKDEEYLDILAKFKLSFNLLALLKVT